MTVIGDYPILHQMKLMAAKSKMGIERWRG